MPLCLTLWKKKKSKEIIKKKKKICGPPQVWFIFGSNNIKSTYLKNNWWCWWGGTWVDLLGYILQNKGWTEDLNDTPNVMEENKHQPTGYFMTWQPENCSYSWILTDLYSISKLFIIYSLYEGRLFQNKRFMRHYVNHVISLKGWNKENNAEFLCFLLRWILSKTVNLN